MVLRFTITGSQYAAITALSPNRIAFIDESNDELRTYRFSAPLFYVTNNESYPYFGVSDSGHAFAESLRVNAGLELFAAATGTRATNGTSSYALSVQGLSYFGDTVEFSRALTLASSTPATTTNSLYNQGGSLYWNGSALQQALTGTQGQTLVFDVNGNTVATSSLFVASDGSVGIGTTTPTYGLTVDGDMLLTGAIRDSLGNTGSNGQSLVSTGSGITWVDGGQLVGRAWTAADSR